MNHNIDLGLSKNEMLALQNLLEGHQPSVHTVNNNMVSLGYGIINKETGNWEYPVPPVIGKLIVTNNNPINVTVMNAIQDFTNQFCSGIGFVNRLGVEVEDEFNRIYELVKAGESMLADYNYTMALKTNIVNSKLKVANTLQLVWVVIPGNMSDIVQSLILKVNSDIKFVRCEVGYLINIPV